MDMREGPSVIEIEVWEEVEVGWVVSAVEDERVL